MKAMTILGSRNRQGRTAQSADAMLKGLAAGGGGSDKVFLTDLKIERCRQCDDAGWGVCRTEGRCAIEDDFAGLVAQIKAADAAIFANPVYFGDLSESMKAFLDRLRRICRHANGKAGIEGKPAVGICMAGGGGGGASNCCMLMEKVLATCGFAVMDMVPVRRQNLPMKLAVLQAVGQYLAGNPPVQ